MMDFDQFIQWEDTTRDTLDVKKIYIDMADDLIAGILLSQIVYWHLPSRNGGQRLRVQHDGKYWIAKARHEWWDECRISPKQFDRALDILAVKGVVESHLYKFDNNPTKHIRIVKEQFMCLFEATLKADIKNPFLPKGKKRGSSPKGKKELPETGISLTESTTETTTEIPTSKDVGVIAKPRKKNELYDAIAETWNTDAGGWIGSLKSMLLGTAKRGAWKDCNFDIPVTVEELRAFRDWNTTRGWHIPKTPEEIQRRFYDFRRIGNAAPMSEQSDTPQPVENPARPDYPYSNLSAEQHAKLDALEAQMRNAL